MLMKVDLTNNLKYQNGYLHRSFHKKILIKDIDIMYLMTNCHQIDKIYFELIAANNKNVS